MQKKFALSHFDRHLCYNCFMNKKKIERLIIITNRIKSGVYPNTKDLLDYYEAKTGDKSSIATISRDLNTLCTSFHAPLYFDKSKNGYYFSDDNWQFALNSISSKDIFYLSAAKSLLAALDGNPIYQEIKDAINFVINTQSKANEELLRRIAVPPKPKLCIDEEVWHLLSLALLENKVITFDYKTRGKDSPERRTVRPYQLLTDSYECCLYGYAEERSETRLYNIARIKNITLTNEVFELPKDYDFSSKCGGGKFGAYSSDKAGSGGMSISG